MEAEILKDVRTYLGDEVSDADSSLLLILIRRAIHKVCARRYPWGCTDEEMKEAAKKYRDTVFDAAVYYWAKQGAEGQNSSSENGISRGYQDEDAIYTDIVPMAKII